MWELPESGEPCGPTELTVTASVVGAPTVTVVARTAGGLRVEQTMTIVAGIATATFAGFPAGTAGPGEVESLRLQLLVTDHSGTIQVPGPTVELRELHALMSAARSARPDHSRWGRSGRSRA